MYDKKLFEQIEKIVLDNLNGKLGDVCTISQIAEAMVAWKNDKTGDVSCPFCGDGGFDLIGLKYHLENYCSVYDETEGVRT